MARKLNLSKWLIAVIVVIVVVAIILGVLGGLGYLTPKKSSDGKHTLPGAERHELGPSGTESGGAYKPPFPTGPSGEKRLFY